MLNGSLRDPAPCNVDSKPTCAVQLAPISQPIFFYLWTSALLPVPGQLPALPCSCLTQSCFNIVLVFVTLGLQCISTFLNFSLTWRQKRFSHPPFSHIFQCFAVLFHFAFNETTVWFIFLLQCSLHYLTNACLYGSGKHTASCLKCVLVKNKICKENGFNKIYCEYRFRFFLDLFNWFWYLKTDWEEGNQMI